MSRMPIKKIIALKCCCLILCNNNEPFLYCIVICDGKWILYDNWWRPDKVAGPRRSSELLPKAKLAPQKRSLSLFGGLLPIWSTTAFWIPAKPLHLRSMLSKSTRCTENCSASSLHWSTERAQCFSMTTSNCMLPNQCFKSWTNWAIKFCLICHIHLTTRQLTTTSSSILTTFCREIPPQSAGGRKCFSKVPWTLKQNFLCYRNKQTFLFGKKWIDCNGP